MNVKLEVNHFDIPKPNKQLPYLKQKSINEKNLTTNHHNPVY